MAYDQTTADLLRENEQLRDALEANRVLELSRENERLRRALEMAAPWLPPPHQRTVREVLAQVAFDEQEGQR